jgi:hypothetical protein
MSERINISLTGEAAGLFLEVQRLLSDGDRPMKNPQVVARCAELAMNQRTKVMCAWTELMVGTTNAMSELGVEEDAIKVIQWCNLLMQQVLTGNVPAGLARQMTGVADDWIRQRKEEMMLEYEESLREAMG